MFKLITDLSEFKCPYVIISDGQPPIVECQRAYCPFSHSEEDDSSQMDVDQSTLEDSNVGSLLSGDNENSTDVPNHLSNDETAQSQDVNSNLHDNSDDDIIVIEDDPEPNHLEQGETQNPRDENRELQIEDRTRDRHRSPDVIYTSDLLRKYNINREDVLGKNFSCVLRLNDIGPQLLERGISTIAGSVSLPVCRLEQTVPLTPQYRASKLKKCHTLPARSSISSGGKTARKRRLSNGHHRTSGKHSRLHESPTEKRPEMLLDLFGNDSSDLFGQDNDSSDDFQEKRTPLRKATPIPNRDKSLGQDPRNKSRKIREMQDAYSKQSELVRKFISPYEVEDIEFWTTQINNPAELRPLYDKVWKPKKDKRQKNERNNSSEPSSTIKATVVSDVPSSRSGMSGTALSDVCSEPAPLLVQKRKREAHPAADSKRQQVKQQTISSKQRPATYRQQLDARREEITPSSRRLSSDSERNSVKKQSRPSVVPITMVGPRSPVAGSSEKKFSLLKRGQQQSMSRFVSSKPISAASSISSSRSLSMDSKPKYEPRIVVPSKQAPRSRVAHPNAQSDGQRAPNPIRTVDTKIKYDERVEKIHHLYKVAMEYFGNHDRVVKLVLTEEEKAAEVAIDIKVYRAKIVGVIIRWKKDAANSKTAATARTPSSPPPHMQLPKAVSIRQQRQSIPAPVIVKRQQKQQHQRQHHARKQQSSPALQNNSNLMKVSFNKPTRIAHGAAPSHSSAAYRSLNSSLPPNTSVQPRQKKSQNNGSGVVSPRKFYDDMLKFIMTEEQLEVNGYPRPTETRGRCCFKDENSKKQKSVSRRKECIRCTKEFLVSDHSDDDQDCYFHGGRMHSFKVGSSYEKRYSCCQNTIGSSGCQWSQSHVHSDNKRDCSNYVKTRSRELVNPRKSPGVYAIDCEMCYTMEGFELTRVSVISQVPSPKDTPPNEIEYTTEYDTFVKPKGRVLDYNTKFSGVEEKDLVNEKTTIEDVQRELLRRFSAETILVGHSLESDLVALRMIHSTVVDTSIVFPHRLGPPLKRALRNLMVDKLGRVIQSADNNGHDSTEDAKSCLQLMAWKIRDSRPAGEA